MVLALIKKPFVWVWALITAPLRWLRGGRRRHRRGLFSKVGDLMPTFSFMSFVRGGQDESIPMQCERDQHQAGAARAAWKRRPPPPKKRATFFGKKASKSKQGGQDHQAASAVARQEGRRLEGRRRPTAQSFSEVPLASIATCTPLPGRHLGSTSHRALST